MTVLATGSITAAQLTTSPVVAPPRSFLPCAACRTDSAFVVGRFGYEVYECFSCGRRRALRPAARRDRSPAERP